MPRDDYDICTEISVLWCKLNSHTTVEGCTIAEDGTVNIYCWYRCINSENGKSELHPIELSLGKPAIAVIRALKNALKDRVQQKQESSQKKTNNRRKKR